MLALENKTIEIVINKTFFIDVGIKFK